VQNYHADNGIFRAHKWVNACHSSGQGLTFAGVNAHHQNGIAERRIRELQELARTMLIHANKHWPQCATANLWPYTIWMANNVLNETPSLRDKSRRSPLQIFADTMVKPNSKHWKPFGCPVYVLDSSLQAGNIHHKWKQRSRVGIYIGRSPQKCRTGSQHSNGTGQPTISCQVRPKFPHSETYGERRINVAIEGWIRRSEGVDDINNGHCASRSTSTLRGSHD
jgi:hypothetical protein